MSARAVLFGSLLLAGGSALAVDDEMPDLELIEYLGMWEESDEEWLIFEEPIAADNDERSEPAPPSEASAEKDDDS